MGMEYMAGVVIGEVVTDDDGNDVVRMFSEEPPSIKERVEKLEAEVHELRKRLIYQRVI
jgi:hypothetical protein